MAHNFKQVGDYYVSQKYGNDANAGTDPNSPKKTIQAGLNLLTTTNKTLVIGSGHYKEAVSKTFTVNTLSKIVGDGNVICEGDGGNSFILQNLNTSGSDSSTFDVYNIYFKNYANVRFRASNGGSGAVGASGLSNIAYLYNCSFENLSIQSDSLGSGTRAWHYYCKFINTNINYSTSGSATSGLINRCLFINSTLNGSFIGSYNDNYSDLTSSIKLASSGTFNNNNIRYGVGFNLASTVTTGTYQDVVGAYYNLAITTSTGTGTVGDPYGRPLTANAVFSLSVSKVLYPNANTRSINADPLFNDAANLNFTLQSGSPHIKGASDGFSNIGGTQYGVYYSATSAEFTTGATVTNLTLAGGAYTISAGFTQGTIRSDALFCQWPRIKPLDLLPYIGGLEFNKDITPPAAGNNNVPNYTTYTSGAGAIPDRLKIRMRFSTQQTKPSIDAHWDNGGYFTAGNWELFEINVKPKIDPNGKGNGDPAYIETTTMGDIIPSWIQVEIILRNDNV